jgi:hypothetical protein
MPSNSTSREKYPHHVDLALTVEQWRRAGEIARLIGAVHERRGPVHNAGIRYAIDFCFISLLSQSSPDQTEQPSE